jgi:hypothetical protein
MNNDSEEWEAIKRKAEKEAWDMSLKDQDGCKKHRRKSNYTKPRKRRR